MDSDVRLPLPRWNGHADDVLRTLTEIHAWASSPALLELVRASGGSETDTIDFAHLDAFSSAAWDFRGGAERDLARTVRLDRSLERLVLQCAPVMGLADRERPSRARYDVVILTGGMVRAGIVKPRYVTQLMQSGIGFGRVVFLGAHRAFSVDEVTLARALGVSGGDEVDGMLEGIRREFRPDDRGLSTEGSSGPVSTGSWGKWSWAETAPSIQVVAAPSADPHIRRANTADTFRFWAERFADSARSVLVVTTPIYVPYQAAVAVETLGIEAGFTVETVGVSPSANDLEEWTQPFTARHHLQELRSAIRGMASLERALIEVNE